ncbi:ABC transporter ATP-binding protein [Clostridium gasigenes]|uniref:ABC transporter ATP-binding protein n=1 Tax=Clostridium gasigenes TaxID=94869 RepID=UPI0016250FAC|nr:ABC transporter ATP-binding protein [Clostridium gasigenes]MBB6625278.1 ABC transporter ATP-binding protein [Clostridium gasigenes]MBU3089892.1 ABC transporter ATP-binding protein [Clostridium gasigenes]MBU3133396.1 ABC transporter ATP-binding protein [Clostridium gasigenes]
MNIVEVKNLSKRFNDKLVLDNVSFEIKKGEIFGLLGPNGAGKSTLINTMVGLIKADNGDVLVGDYSINKDPINLKKKIGIVPQEIALFEILNARENLEYFGGLYGLKGTMLKERINEAIEIAGLGDCLKKKVKEYSGGMKRRLNIVVAMMHHPEVLLMDEPTVGVDPQSRNHIFEVVKKMNSEFNTTIIYTSHYMEEVEHLCNKIFIMDLGKEVAYGTNDELKRMVNSGKIIRLKGKGELDTLMLSLKSNKDVRAVEKTGDELKIVINDKYSLNDLLVEIQGINLNVKNIGIEEPTLEEVFLSLTGKQLRDGEE